MGAAVAGRSAMACLLEKALTARNTHPAARPDIGHGDKQQQKQPEYTGHDDHLRQTRAVPDVHEEQHDERGFTDRDRQRHENVPSAQIHRRDKGRYPREDNEREEDREVNPLRYDMVLAAV